MSLVLVTGTGTEVGKTWTLVQLVTELRARGRHVRVRKPAQSYAPAELGATDAELLAAASGEDAAVVCAPHRWYEVPMAPVMAADALGRSPFTIAGLAAEILGEPDDPAATDSGVVTFVEGAGGPRSPLASDGDTVDLARALGCSRAVLVADAGLGTINSVRLCVETLHGFTTLVFLNRHDESSDLHRRNRAWLESAGYPVTTSIGGLADALSALLP